jgi:hypothetical protein
LPDRQWQLPNIAIKPQPMMCYKEAVKIPPMPLVERAVTSDRFQMFEVSVRKRRRLWLWSVSTAEGRVVVKGAASTRSAAKYSADRALLMLLLSAPWKLRQRKPYKDPL